MRVYRQVIELHKPYDHVFFMAVVSGQLVYTTIPSGTCYLPHRDIASLKYLKEEELGEVEDLFVSVSTR